VIKHIRWQILLVLVGVGLLVALLVYVALNFTTVWVAGQGGTYVEGLAGTPTYINPLLCQTSQTDGDLCSLIFNALTRLDHNGRVVADLARRWEISPDGLSYTFYLQPGVRWHDGTPFTAADVVFTIGLLQDPNFPGPLDWAELGQTVTVTEVDPSTVRFDLQEPFAPFLDYTTVGILPQHALRGVPVAELPAHPFNVAPVGTGAFRFTEVVTATSGLSHIILETNPFYLGPKPMLSRIQLKFLPTYQAVYQAFLDGEVQGIGRVAEENLAEARANPALQLFSSTLPRYTLIYLNLTSDTAPFLAEREVRQALLHALDRQALIDHVLDGQAVVAHSPVLPESWAYDSTIATYPYDPQKAGQLLEEAGWHAVTARATASLTDTAALSPTITAWFKDRRPLSFTLLVPNDPLRIALGEEITRQWSQSGIQVALEPVSGGLVNERLEPRQYEAALVELDLTLSGDPDPYPFWHETAIEPPGQNYAGYDSREMSEVLETARLMPDQEARARLYHEFQQLYGRDVPALLLYHPVYTYGVDQYVYGVHVGPLVRPGDRFLGIADWYVRLRRAISSDRSAEAPEAEIFSP
jgi:peptide/nickel transport system substrate-binding protein